MGHLGTVWEVGHCSEEGVLGVKDASLAHVPDLEASYQAWYKHSSLTPQVNHIPRTYTDTTKQQCNMLPHMASYSNMAFLLPCMALV